MPLPVLGVRVVSLNTIQSNLQQKLGVHIDDPGFTAGQVVFLQQYHGDAE